MLHIALHLSRLNCSTSNTQTMLYPSMLTQSSCLVLCLVSLIMLNKPPSRNSPLHLLLLLSCPPTPTTTHPFPKDLSHYCHSHCSSLGHSPVCQSWWHWASPPSLCVVTAPCLHRHCGWCQDAPSRRSPSSFALSLSFLRPLHRLHGILVCGKKGVSKCQGM